MLDEPKSSDETFSAYFAKRLIGDKRFEAGVPEEAGKLLEHIALFKADLGLQISCVVDRERDPAKTFSMSRDELFEMGKACLKYTGRVNGAKMPVGISIYEVGAGPMTEADRVRLKGLTKNFVFAKVSLASFYIDTRSGSVWTPLGFNGLLRGTRWIEGLLREPRKKDGEIFVPDAALPTEKRPPIATIAILAALVVVFVIEQLAKAGTKQPDLSGSTWERCSRWEA